MNEEKKAMSEADANVQAVRHLETLANWMLLEWNRDRLDAIAWIVEDRARWAAKATSLQQALKTDFRPIAQRLVDAAIAEAKPLAAAEREEFERAKARVAELEAVREATLAPEGHGGYLDLVKRANAAESELADLRGRVEQATAALTQEGKIRRYRIDRALEALRGR